MRIATWPNQKRLIPTPETARSFNFGESMDFAWSTPLGAHYHKKKLAVFMKRIITVQQMIRCKGVLFRNDWKIINLLTVSGLQEDGPG